VPSTAPAPAAHQPDHIVDLTIDDVAQLPATNRTAAQGAAPAASIDTQIDTSMQDVPSLPGTVATAALENNAVISGTSGQPAAQDPSFGGVVTNAGGVVTNALTAESQPATPQPINPQSRVNHLKIDSSEFKIAVEVPRLGMDRMLHSAMLHGKLNDLLERGLISYDAARAAFRQAQHNQIGW
jgi:hypothetical protein